MKTELRYRDQGSTPPVQATFLRGGNLAEWLRQIGSWQIPLARLECYVVPRSLQSREPAGLLVIFPLSGARIPDDLQHPCHLLGNRLVLPLDAELFPATTAEELDRSLLYPRQFYHPTLGLIGFEATDRLEWGEHLLLAKAPPKEWNHAHPGFAPTPPLQHAKVPPASLGDTLKGLGGDIGTQQLRDDPKESDAQEDDSIFARFKWGLLKGAFQMTKGLMDQFPEGKGPGDGGAGYNAFAKFANWLGSRTPGDGVEDKRMDALDKLLDMLDKNMDEALKYAIPLDNPFAGRGMGEMGSDLGARDTRYDWSKLGGTTQGATWGVDTQRYQNLREKYRQAANDAVAAGDFGKAAYIYAHLLHDFQAAANVLTQGKLYREAAVIYKDQLNNRHAAAECLELGGLLLEAIDLYLELKHWEKAGDLYRKLGKEANALTQYERSVDDALAKADHLAAAKMLHGKMDRLDRALVCYLMGWHDGKQGEACLRRYLDLILVPQVDAGHQVTQLYHRHTPYERRSLLLGIFSDHLPRIQDAAARKVLVDLAYAHYSEQAVGGQPNQLQLLKPFQAGDRMFMPDVARYAVVAGQRPKNKWEPMRLNPNIRWTAACAAGAAFFGIGQERSSLWMARWNHRGDVEYMHWMEEVSEGAQFDLLGHPAHYGELFLFSDVTHSLKAKVWSRNSLFNMELRVSVASALPTLPELCGGCLNASGQVVLLLTGPNGCLTLGTYAVTGELQKSIDCKWTNGDLAVLDWASTWKAFFAVTGGYVAAHDTLLLHITPEGVTSVVSLESEVYALAVGPDQEQPQIAFATENGFHLMPATAHAFEAIDSRQLSTHAGAYLLGFAAQNLLIAAWEDHLEVFEQYSGEWYQLGVAQLEGKVVAMLPFGGNSFSILLENGEIKVYDYDNGNNCSGVSGVFQREA